MLSEQHGWLAHIAESVPIEARKNQTSLYTIALEAWRRGLEVTFYSEYEGQSTHIRYAISDGNKTHSFKGSCGDKVADRTIDICEDKAETNQYLEKAGIPIPQGARFSAEVTNQEIIKRAEHIGYPLVLKPTNGQAGKGVIVNIKNQDQLSKALIHVREKLDYENVILEQYITGDEVRVYVLDGKVLGAANRRPANIVGDGKNTVRTLIDIKNEMRKEIPHLYFRPIQVDKGVIDYIKEQGYTFDSIPKIGERVLLNKVSNVSRGGDPVDVTDILTEEQKQIAISATKAVPDLPHCGVDMILTGNSGKIIELNTRPGIGSHLFPVEGKARNIPKKIIDFYFPDTKDIDTTSSKSYFDFRSISVGLKERTHSSIKLKPHSFLDNKYAVNMIIDDSIDLLSFYQWVKKHAIVSGVNGSLKKLDNGHIELIFAGKSAQQIDTIKKTILKSKKYVFNIVKEGQYDHPVKLGFELIDEKYFLGETEVRALIKELKRESAQHLKESRRLNKRIQQTYDSNSWKLVRYITGFKKR